MPEPVPIPDIRVGDTFAYISTSTGAIAPESAPWVDGEQCPGAVPNVWIHPNISFVVVLGFSDHKADAHRTSTHRDFVRWYRIMVSGHGIEGIGWIHESNLSAASFFRKVETL